MNDDILKRLTEYSFAPLPSRPAHLRLSLQQLRANLAAMPQVEVDSLADSAEDAHHEQVLEHWAHEHSDVGDKVQESNSAHFARWLANFRVDHETVEEVSLEEGARECAGNRTTRHAATGTVTTISGDDKELTASGDEEASGEVSDYVPPVPAPRGEVAWPQLDNPTDDGS
jgi:hypothetical protein